MPLDVTRTRQYLSRFDFKALLLEELGWDSHTASVDVVIDGQTFTLTAIAQKRGMVAFLCQPDGPLGVPQYPTRRKIERQVAKSVHEHLLIYTDPAQTMQIWQWVKREVGKPTACREHTYHRAQPGDALIQKLQVIAFSLDEEERLSLVDVTSRTRAAFDVERVTKRFYDVFQKEHAAFLKFLKGIPDDDLQRWYVSVMLNRLMFVYFIQKKHFLDGNPDYLRTKLGESQTWGRDRFYREFLCPLFFEGFAKKDSERSTATNRLLGKVPYLNGGLFLRHQIEENHGKDIQIADAAFEKLFAFFEQYHWHLDERPLRRDDEINPDVLGYIFEKYINQKQMGAYYTKEDITGYISQNTVIPFLFNAARQKCKIAFEGEQSVWRLLQADPDRYIYEAVKRGVALPLPPEIAAGLNDVAKRTEWNRPASAGYALPTEIWREVVARRTRYEDVRIKLANGEVRDINDLITYNLDIRQYAQDVIENCEGPDLLMAFWRAITTITILDPTGGSGAFIFAALNILEPLYEACLDRMEAFLAEWGDAGKKLHQNYHKNFTEVLARVNAHPNRRYFVLKSIILNNLYAVDIMEEAVEICKLRLFLKLVAQVERVEDIEPLPDIDFNIRAGNTLVGYATYDDVKRAVTSKLDFDNTMARIEEKAQDIDRLFGLFRQMQTEQGMEAKDFADAKLELRKRLQALEDELNRHLAQEYGVDPVKRSSYEEWLASHKPFHWFIEFYRIMKSGGFDVIIGNPPYVEYKDVKEQYTIRGYAIEMCGDLYAYVLERSSNLLSASGALGMIIPVSISSTDGFHALRQLLLSHGSTSWCLGFAERPSKLFTGVEKRLAIWIMNKNASNEVLYLSNYRRWLAEERETLFATQRFTANRNLRHLVGSSIPKVADLMGRNILEKLLGHRQVNSFFCKTSKHIIYYTRKVRYFVQFFDFVPEMRNSQGKLVEPSELKTIFLASQLQRDVLIAALNSGLFYWFFSCYSDVRNVNRREIEAFPCSLDQMSEQVSTSLQGLSWNLMKDFRDNAKLVTGDYGKYGKLTIQTFQPRQSKLLIDEIDRVLAKHYGFTDEELDFIINYDIKYRMGRDAGGADE